jgi:hypothetical protein
MDDYLLGVTTQYIQRGKHLLGEIPTKDLPLEYKSLETLCRHHLKDSIHSLEDLRDGLYSKPSHSLRDQTTRWRIFRRASARISFIETTGIPTLSRHKPQDDFGNRVVHQICKEISYPLPVPTTTPFSTDYFYINPALNLLFTPLIEFKHILHLADLFHELAHPLLDEMEPDPRTSSLQTASIVSIDEARTYIDTLIDEERKKGAVSGFEWYRLWKSAWVWWIGEFFCDLFALYTLGSAYAWSHLHLSIEKTQDPFEVPPAGAETHPADAARMDMLLRGLRILDKSDDADLIQARWEEFLLVGGFKPDSYFLKCYPDHLLDTIAQRVREEVITLGCRLANDTSTVPIIDIINNTWTNFWDFPEDFVGLENQAILQIQVVLT